MTPRGGRVSSRGKGAPKAKAKAEPVASTLTAMGGKGTGARGSAHSRPRSQTLDRPANKKGRPAGK
jgi:hypothetical protein